MIWAILKYHATEMGNTMLLTFKGNGGKLIKYNTSNSVGLVGHLLNNY